MTEVRHSRVRRVATTTLTTDDGCFRMLGYEDDAQQGHVALMLGEVAGTAPLVRVHSECLTGDALGSRRCDCGEQLRAAMREIGREGCGVIVYLRGHEGRGIGLMAKLQAYALQDEGLDTVDANLRLGYPADARGYAAAADILRELGVNRIRLLSSNPDKAAQLGKHGIRVMARHSLPVPDRPENAFYLETKRLRMGHSPQPAYADAWQELRAGRIPPRIDTELVDRYAPLVAAGPQVTVAQLAQSADGFIATRTGDAEYVSGAADREHLHRLRALVDVALVGAATVLADDPQLTVRAVEGVSPTRAVLDPRARISEACRLLTDVSVPTLWMVGLEATVPSDLARHVTVVRLPCDETGFAPRQVLAELRRRGLGRVLVEGGGRLVSAFLGAATLDRLYLTTAPVLLGDGIPGLRFRGTDRLADALRAPARRHVLGADICTEFDLASVRVRAT